MVELVETVLFAVLFGLDAYGYAKLKESERDIDRLQRQAEHGQAESAKMASFYSQKNNEILTRGVPVAASTVDSTSMTITKMDSGEVADIRDKIDSISGDVEHLRSKHDSLSERLDDIETKGVPSDNSEITERVETLEKKVDELSTIVTRVDELEHEFKYASSSMDSQKVSEFASRIEAVETKITSQVTPEASDKTLEKLKEQNKKLNDLKERVLRNEEEIGSLVGESGVNYATLLDRIADGDNGVRKEITSVVEKARKESDKTIATIEKRVVVAEKTAKDEASKVAATVDKKVAVATKAAESVDKRVSAVAKIAEKAEKTAATKPKVITLRAPAPAKKAVAKKTTAAKKAVVVKKSVKATKTTATTKSASVAHHIARNVRAGSEPTKTKVTVETTSGEAEVTTKKA